MQETTIDLVFNSLGIIGVTLIIIAFFAIQSGKIKSTDMAYPLLNLIGAILHLVSLYRFYNIASVVIEIFWIAISVYGILKIRKTKKSV